MNQMQQYQNLLSDIMDNGVDVLNKCTGAVCRTLVGAQMAFDMKEGFPALTTRKLPFKNIVGELLGFFRGYTSAAQFRALGCKFWDANANETKAWLDNPFRTGTDDLGRIYGKQWTAWESIKMIKHAEPEVFCEKTNHLVLKGYKFVGLFTNHDVNHLEGKGTYNVLMKNINQLEEAVVKILTDPSDRRIIVSGWNPGDKEQQSLPACFTHDALVTMEKGYRYISAVNVGDFVLTDKGVLKEVLNTFKTEYKGEMIKIKTKCVTHHINCTPNHPFLVKDKGWVEGSRGVNWCAPEW
jgi:thymidylate synthase